nr:uncharacterized protein LOC111414286 [Onthophagus taurus]
MMKFIITSILLFYAILKDLIWTPITLERIDTCWGYKILINFVFVTLSIICLVLYQLCISPFILFKFFVHIHLKATHGSLYGGMLDGHSAIFEAYDHKKMGIVTMMIVFIHGRYHDFYKLLKLTIDRMCIENQKLSSKVCVCWGYQYYLDEHFTSKDILRDMSVSGCKYITRNKLMDYLESYNIVSDNLWEIVIFKQPIAWDFKVAHRSFGIMLRVNHCLVDGYHLIGLLQKYLFDYKYTPIRCISCGCKNTKLNLDEAYILDNPIKFLASPNIVLRTWPRQFVTTYIEGSVKYVPIIKQIKRYTHVTFSIVLIAGIYSAIADFMKEKCCGWDRIDIFHNVRANLSETEEILKGNYKCELKNCYTTLSVVLALKKKHSSFLNIVKYVNQEYRYSRESMGEQLVEFLAHYVWNYLPIPLIKKPYEYDCFTRNIVHFSNMLEIKEESIFGNTIVDVFSFMPLFCSKGMILSILTYNGLLKMTLAAREGIISSRSELKSIMKGTINFIDNLAKELMIIDEKK